LQVPTLHQKWWCYAISGYLSLTKTAMWINKKPLIFDADSCRYDVILGADFLSKTGIDARYSTGSIEWFDNNLPLCDTCYLQSKDFLDVAETIEIQLEDGFSCVDWYDLTCYASEILDAKYKSSLLMMLLINLII
jgi:hypothetical protein